MLDFQTAQLLIVPAVTVIMQALKRIAWVGENNQYIPILSIVLAGATTVAWAIVQDACAANCILEAVLRGCVFGAAAVGLYELLKPPST